MELFVWRALGAPDLPDLSQFTIKQCSKKLLSSLWYCLAFIGFPRLSRFVAFHVYYLAKYHNRTHHSQTRLFNTAQLVILGTRQLSWKTSEAINKDLHIWVCLKIRYPMFILFPSISPIKIAFWVNTYRIWSKSQYRSPSSNCRLKPHLLLLESLCWWLKPHFWWYQ